ncbi:MAG: hypothetical protein IJ068_06085 [Bacilli bacterium]|nr:hypothetical protein [Bacilli bacterium]
MDKNFKLYSYILDFDDYTRKYVVNNIPSVDRDIRIHLLDEIYNLEKSIIYAINTKGNIRIKHLIDSKVSISLIDMLFLKIRDIKCLKSSKLNTSIDKLTNVKNIVYGWIVNEEKS